MSIFARVKCCMMPVSDPQQHAIGCLSDPAQRPPELPKSPRQRMEALGWFHSIEEDCLNVGWVKVAKRADGRNEAVAYGNEPEFRNDLERCQAEAKAEGWYDLI